MNMNFLTARRYLCDSVSCQNVQGIVNGWKSLFVKQPLSLATQGFQNYVSFFFFQQITVCPIILFSNYRMCQKSQFMHELMLQYVIGIFCMYLL